MERRRVICHLGGLPRAFWLLRACNLSKQLQPALAALAGHWRVLGLALAGNWLATGWHWLILAGWPGWPGCTAAGARTGPLVGAEEAPTRAKSGHSLAC